jgi:hypothetical protein
MEGKKVVAELKIAFAVGAAVGSAGVGSAATEGTSAAEGTVAAGLGTSVGEDEGARVAAKGAANSVAFSNRESF